MSRHIGFCDWPATSFGTSGEMEATDAMATSAICGYRRRRSFI